MIALNNYRASEEVANLIAKSDPVRVLSFRPSPETVARVSELIEKEKLEEISPDEVTELNHYMHLEHLMRHG